MNAALSFSNEVEEGGVDSAVPVNLEPRATFESVAYCDTRDLIETQVILKFDGRHFSSRNLPSHMVYHFLKKLYRSPIVIHHSLRKVFIHNLGPLDKESPGMWHRVSAGSCWQALCTHIYAQKPPALFPSLAFTNLGVKLCRSEVGRGLCSLELCMTGLGMVATG